MPYEENPMLAQMGAAPPGMQQGYPSAMMGGPMMQPPPPGATAGTYGQKPKPKRDKDAPIPDIERNDVARWTSRIKTAKTKFKPDFDRMEQNIQFVAGMQWNGQTSIDDDRYVCNMTLQMVNQKVATLYAKNPQAEWTRRDRLDFQVWDGEMTTIMQALEQAAVTVADGQVDPQAMAVLNDYEMGTTRQKVVERMGETLRILYQYQIDNSEPDFKEEMKDQVVTQAIVCGVGYVKASFCRDVTYAPSELIGPRTTTERVRSAKLILQRIEDGELDETSPEVQQLKSLIESFGLAQSESEQEVSERIVFDFPSPLSVIVDPRCRSLKTFSGARWIVQEYMLPLDEVNAFFEVDIPRGGDLIEYGEDWQERQYGNEDRSGPSCPIVCLWEIFDITTKSRLCIVNGYKGYACPPEQVQPLTHRFWPIYGVTFNRVVACNKRNITLYPPSDVQLVKHPQKEWNRTRNSLRKQRVANAPKYVTRKGHLTDNDKAVLNNAAENQVIELEGLPHDSPPSDFLTPMAHAPIDPLAYDTKPLQEDFMYAARAQEANMGPAKPNVTATVGAIAEESRQTVAESNVSDLDALLTALAKACGEMLLREMSVENVVKIVGPGAVWPMEDREQYLNEIALQTRAASSGRPNQAIAISNFERIGPLLLQAGANPMFVVREAVRRLDDRLRVQDAFPINTPLAPSAPQQGSTKVPAERPTQEPNSEVSVPLPAA